MSSRCTACSPRCDQSSTCASCASAGPGSPLHQIKSSNQIESPNQMNSINQIIESLNQIKSDRIIESLNHRIRSNHRVRLCANYDFAGAFGAHSIASFLLGTERRAIRSVALGAYHRRHLSHKQILDVADEVLWRDRWIDRGIDREINIISRCVAWSTRQSTRSRRRIS